MLLGSEQLLASSRLNGLRVGILANPASIDHDFATSRSLSRSNRFKARRDLRAAARLSLGPADNMIETPHAKDKRRDVPIFSLYSEDARADQGDARPHRRARRLDLQDVGARIYTFIYTMANCLRARPARRAGHRVRSPQPNRRHASGRTDARAGL